MVINELRDASDPVAAHFRLAAVGIEHAHARVRLVGGADEDQPIRTDPEMPIADGPAQSSRIMRHRVAEAIDVDILVADAVHFGETHVSSHVCPRAAARGLSDYSHSIVAGGLLLIS